MFCDSKVEGGLHVWRVTSDVAGTWCKLNSMNILKHRSFRFVVEPFRGYPSPGWLPLPPGGYPCNVLDWSDPHCPATSETEFFVACVSKNLLRVHDVTSAHVDLLPHQTKYTLSFIRNLGRAGPGTESFLAFGDLEYSKFLNSFLK